MITRFIGFLIILTTLYLMLIFVAPGIADQYGNKDFNTKVRIFKDESLQFASGSDSATSLFDKLRNTATGIVQDTKKSIESLHTSVDTKVNQVHEASIAVEKAYTGIVDAANKIQNLTGTGK